MSLYTKDGGGTTIFSYSCTKQS
ncbi:hypothetical protein M8C21_032278 [Ambrosia artemisiifolia]|uniref:Uncharacterized protein n=1 Tax=Ambrosia artemisiifolia TaxID=4212 RepID=A0AAD5D0G9_AMBAR|nr:hypothetical protein M8C21_023487 [Ambrosia artemisiifolia]KAI7753535.1 hypothetical protein M8C21_032278 [Ambrosia artemisiifolia]